MSASSPRPFAKGQTLRALLCLATRIAHPQYAPDDDALHDPRTAIVLPEALPDWSLSSANPYQVLVLSEALSQLHDFAYRLLALIGDKLVSSPDGTPPLVSSLESVLSGVLAELADIANLTLRLQKHCLTVTADLDAPDWSLFMEPSP